jgi:L-ascorbate metabolism protein UlaG (beta-lactamase superfamily)
MFITWIAHSCFQIETKSAGLVIDPYEEKIGYRLPSLKAEVVLKTHDHFDHNNVQAVRGKTPKEKPFLIKGPGEYNIKDISIYGISSFHDEVQGAERGLNTIYIIESEGISVVHLGDFGQEELLPQQIEAIGRADILLVPVGGVYTINGTGAARAVHRLEPKLVVPMHFKIPGLKVDIEDETTFLKELGVSPQTQESLKISAGDLPENGFEVVLLKPAAKPIK